MTIFQVSYYRILETYIIFDIYKLLLLSQGRNYRSTRARLYKQQEKFAQFLYRLSSAPYKWGMRGRRRYADNRSNDEKKKYFYVKYHVLFILFHKCY